MIKLYVCKCGWYGERLPFITKQEGNWETEAHGCPECKELLSSKHIEIKEVPAKLPDSGLPFKTLVEHPEKGLVPVYGEKDKDGFTIPDEQGNWSYYKFDQKEWGDYYNSD